MIWGCWALWENQDSEIRAGAILCMHLANNCWKPGGHNKIQEVVQREQKTTSAVQALNHHADSAAWFYSGFIHGFIKFSPVLLRRWNVICGLSPVRIQHAALYTGLWLKKKEKSQRTSRWMSRSEGELHINRGRDESRRSFENVNTARPSMKTIHPAAWETIASSSLPTDFCPNTELTIGHHQSCVYPELHRALCWNDGWNSCAGPRC